VGSAPGLGRGTGRRDNTTTANALSKKEAEDKYAVGVSDDMQRQTITLAKTALPPA